ncbi:MAG: hypothetical protein HUU28_16365, partial [Planctomycetaceae bacterium]|nr:hypothetical protein [Planctomycetaceae bacterium]
MDAPSIEVWLSDTQGWIEGELASRLRRTHGVPPVLAEALEYAVLGGGKRFRAALVRLVARWHGASDAECA